MTLHFDNDNLRKVARIVLQHNKYAVGRSIEDQILAMQWTADTSSIGADLGYVATGGYALCAYRRPDGSVGVKAFPADHLFD